MNKQCAMYVEGETYRPCWGRLTEFSPQHAACEAHVGIVLNDLDTDFTDRNWLHTHESLKMRNLALFNSGKGHRLTEDSRWEPVVLDFITMPKAKTPWTDEEILTAIMRIAKGTVNPNRVKEMIRVGRAQVARKNVMIPSTLRS